MRPGYVLGVYLLAVMLGGAWLAPWLHWAMQWMAECHPAWRDLAEIPFHRLVSRGMLGVALLGLWPVLRLLRIGSWAELGLARDKAVWSRLTFGFALGFVSLACVALLVLTAEVRTLKTHYTMVEMLRKILNAGVSALAVGWLEEILFRGSIFGGLRKSCHWKVALLASSGIYALVHFLQKPAAPEVVEWHSGFAALAGMLGGFAQSSQVVPGFFVLTLAGAILGYGYQRTGTLYFSIGLHAGWVFWLKFYGAMTSAHSDGPVWFWGTRKLYDGWLSFFVLTLVLVWCIISGRKKSHEFPTS